MTEPGGDAWRQATYYPYYFASLFGRGTALQLAVKSPVYDAAVADDVPYLDISGVQDEEQGTLTFFAVNRSGDEAVDVEINLVGFGDAQVLDHQVMTHASLQAVNTLTKQTEVVPRRGTGALIDGNCVSVTLPSYSYQVLRLKLTSALGA
jgi:alpha-N-arabinofuranosidase